jgi:hypothetical protein
MQDQFTGDRRQLKWGVVPGCQNSSVLGYMVKEIVDLHDGYYTAAERILDNPKFSKNQNIGGITQVANRRFDNIQGMIKKFTEQLKQEQNILIRDIDNALVRVALEDRWWEAMNIFSHGMDEPMAFVVYLGY